MKKYNKFNKQLLAIWVLIPILLFFIILNSTYAYLTASAQGQTATTATAKVQIKFPNTTEATISTAVSNSTTVTTVILPGDVLNISTAVENLSDVKVYLLLKLSVDIKKSGETNATNVSTKFYALSGSSLIQVTQTAGASTADTSDDNFSSYALTQDAKTTSNTFNITYTFAGAEYDNSYALAQASYTLTGYAIQFPNVSSLEATATLWELANN